MKTKGQETLQVTKCEVGSPDKPVDLQISDYGSAEQADPSMRMASYGRGRTISLGNYESVRIFISASQEAVGDAAFAEVEAFVEEILAREEALVRRMDRAPATIPVLSGRRREIRVDYGLTLNAAARYESHKVEIGFSRPLTDGEDAGMAIKSIQDDLASRISDVRSKVRGA